MKNIYLLDHKIKFKTYKAIHDNIVKDPGPTPAGKDKILWEMIKNKQMVQDIIFDRIALIHLLKNFMQEHYLIIQLLKNHETD